jgi:hypothetical protein
MNSQGFGGCDFDGPQTLATPARNNYFYGKLLDEQHFRMEQRYFNTKRWLLNRLAVGEGVLCGLGLGVTQDGQRLTLAPGVAIDGLGREILVPVATVFDPRQLTDSWGKPAGAAAPGTTVIIRLAYHPCAAEPMPVLVPDCDSTTRCAPGIIREAFAVLVSQEPQPSPAPAAGWPPATFFEPQWPNPRIEADALIKEVVDRVDQACPEPPKPADAAVLLARVHLPPDSRASLSGEIDYSERPVLLSQETLFRMLLALWERVEQGLGGSGGGVSVGGASNVGPGGAGAGDVGPGGVGAGGEGG